MQRVLTVFVVIAAFLLCGTACATAPKCVDVESASAKELSAKLAGVGDAKAKAIVTYRATHRAKSTKAKKAKWNFNNWATLLKVPGIGPDVCKKNVAKVCFGTKIQKPCPKKK